MKKRIISLLLAVCMVLSLVPTMVFAVPVDLSGDINGDAVVNVDDAELKEYKHKSFHADNYCFDSKPERELFWQYIMSDKVKEIFKDE